MHFQLLFNMMELTLLFNPGVFGRGIDSPKRPLGSLRSRNSEDRWSCNTKAPSRLAQLAAILAERASWQVSERMNLGWDLLCVFWKEEMLESWFRLRGGVICSGFRIVNTCPSIVVLVIAPQIMWIDLHRRGRVGLFALAASSSFRAHPDAVWRLRLDCRFLFGDASDPSPEQFPRGHCELNKNIVARP